MISEHNAPSTSLASSGGYKSRVLQALMRLTYPTAKATIAVSEGVARDLVELLSLDRAAVLTLYNPITIDDFQVEAEEPLDDPWFAEGEPPVILGVGRLSAQKDFETLVRAFAVVRAQRPARLLILGEGTERPRIESLVSSLRLDEAVRMPGFVMNPFKYMKRSSVFVLSSRWEGFGNVLVEAMACGVPVVSTDCPSGPAEILENGKWGRLVPVGDFGALADAVISTLASGRRSACARAHDFDVESAVDGYLGVLLPIGKQQQAPAGRDAPLRGRQ